jgi:type 1 glutamine amidotransferase
MKFRVIFSLLLAICVGTLLSGFTEKKKVRLLVFSKTAGFRHSSIGAGKLALLKMGAAQNWLVDTTEDAGFFTSDNLKKYDAVIFLSTTGNILDSAQQQAFEQFIRSGKGFAGIHAATDTEYDWPWYVGLVGASFESHPKQQTARLYRTDKAHLSTVMLPDTWERFDEWYNFKNINPATHTLLRIDESSYTGGKNGDQHAMAWYHEFGGGRSFYTALGHTDASYSEPLFLAHITGGINYVLGVK